MNFHHNKKISFICNNTRCLLAFAGVLTKIHSRKFLIKIDLILCFPGGSDLKNLTHSVERTRFDPVRKIPRVGNSNPTYAYWKFHRQRTPGGHGSPWGRAGTGSPDGRANNTIEKTFNVRRLRRRHHRADGITDSMTQSLGKLSTYRWTEGTGVLNVMWWTWLSNRQPSRMTTLLSAFWSLKFLVG